jgi:hypothetical protein
MDNDNQFELLRAMLNQVNSEKEKQSDANKETIRRLRIQNTKLLEQVKLLKDQVKNVNTEKAQMSSNLNLLLKLNNSLAEALGSCTNCWGEDAECTNCQGQGSPGWRQINKRFFNRYVLPGLEKLYGLSKEQEQ